VRVCVCMCVSKQVSAWIHSRGQKKIKKSRIFASQRVMFSLQAGTQRLTSTVSPTLCIKLQDTARHCNTLQHTTTHCNTLHHMHRLTTSTVRDQRCNTMQQSAAHCSTMLHHTATDFSTATHCKTLQHTATHRNTPHQSAVHCNTILHHPATDLSTATHCTTPSTLHHTAPHAPMGIHR